MIMIVCEVAEAKQLLGLKTPTPQVMKAPVKKKMGRPKGSKNKPKSHTVLYPTNGADLLDGDNRRSRQRKESSGT